MEAGSASASDFRKEQTDKIVRACAEACGVDPGFVEKIGSASEEQECRMDHHISTGSSYMMQMVLHCEGGLNQDFLLRALSALRSKNHILRTRLVRLEGQVYQVVLRDGMMYQQAAVGLQPFLEHNRLTRMDYGAPLFRYAFIREPHGEVFFVWTGESLQTEFIPKMSPRPNILSLHISPLQCCRYMVGSTYFHQCMMPDIN